MFSSMISSLTTDRSNDYPSAREMTLKDMGKIGPYITTRKYKHVHNSCYIPHSIARELFKYKMLSHNYISLRSNSLTTPYIYIKISIPGLTVFILDWLHLFIRSLLTKYIVRYFIQILKYHTKSLRKVRTDLDYRYSVLSLPGSCII